MNRPDKAVSSYYESIRMMLLDDGQPRNQIAPGKLLATEDLVVEHRHVETAQFNVHTRVLTLPKWEKASSFVYDMLVGHEVGHALYTPDVNWIKDRNIPPQFVNVVEDVRIEKLMKRRYAGISKTFIVDIRNWQKKISSRLQMNPSI